MESIKEHKKTVSYYLTTRVLSRLAEAQKKTGLHKSVIVEKALEKALEIIEKS